jgi:hypothetical protein
MPFLMDLDDAIETMVRGIRASSPIVAFPWQLATIMRAGTLMPTAIYDKFAGGYRKRPNGHTPRSTKGA